MYESEYSSLWSIADSLTVDCCIILKIPLKEIVQNLNFNNRDYHVVLVIKLISVLD